MDELVSACLYDDTTDTHLQPVLCVSPLLDLTHHALLFSLPVLPLALRQERATDLLDCTSVSEPAVPSTVLQCVADGISPTAVLPTTSFTLDPLLCCGSGYWRHIPDDVCGVV